jgi:hypothetical protein
VLSYYLEVKPIQPHEHFDELQSRVQAETTVEAESNDQVQETEDESQTSDNVSDADSEPDIALAPAPPAPAPAAVQQNRGRIRSLSKHSNEEFDDKVIMRRMLLRSRTTTFGASASSLVSVKSAKSNVSGNTATTNDSEAKSLLLKTASKNGKCMSAGKPGNIDYLRLVSESRLNVTPQQTTGEESFPPPPASRHQELTARDLLKGSRKWSSFTRSRTSSSGTTCSGGNEATCDVRRGSGVLGRRWTFRHSRSTSTKPTALSGDLSSPSGSNREISEV